MEEIQRRFHSHTVKLVKKKVISLINPKELQLSRDWPLDIPVVGSSAVEE
jgi:hypothetical protein